MKQFVFFFIIVSTIGCTVPKNKLSEKEVAREIQKAAEQNSETKTLVDGWYHIVNYPNEFKRIEKETNTAYYINPYPIVLPINFERAKEFKNYEGKEGLAIYFDKVGIEKWAEATKKAEDSFLVFILSDNILSVQKVNSQIINGLSAFWKGSMSEADYRKIQTMVIK